MSKIALKGFANLRAFPITKNDAANYDVGEKLLFIGGRSCVVDDQRTEYSIPGDDGVYEQGSELAGTTLTIGVNEMSLENLAALTGAAYKKAELELSESDLDNAPEVALVFSAIRSDKGYRLYRYYVAKLVGYKADLKARLENQNDVSQYQLTFKCSSRVAKAEGETKPMLRVTKDVAAGEPLTWLDTIPKIGA